MPIDPFRCGLLLSMRGIWAIFRPTILEILEKNEILENVEGFWMIVDGFCGFLRILKDLKLFLIDFECFLIF